MEIPVSQYLDKAALRDGVDAADIYLGQRAFRAIYSVYGSTKGDGWDKLDALMAAFDPVICFNSDTANVGFLPLTYFRPTASISTWPTSTYPYGIPLQMYIRPAAPPSYPTLKRAAGGTKGVSFRVSVPLMARDPRQYLQTTVSISVTTASQNTTATHRGTHPVFPSLSFTVSGAGSSAARFFVNNGSVRLDLATTTTGTFTLDWATGQILDSNNDLANRLFSSAFTQVFGQIEGGGSQVVIENTTNLTGTLTWREAWL